MYYDATMVCEGGAMLGIYTAGILDVLTEKQIFTTHGIGVSVGSCNIIGYAAGQIGRTKDCLIVKDENLRYFGLPSIKRTGRFYDFDMCFDEYALKYQPFHFEDFAKSPMKTECVATDVETGRPIYFPCLGEDHQCMRTTRASSSMPFLSDIFECEGYKCLDGSVSKSIPIQRAIQYGTSKIVVISTKPAGYYMKKPTAAYEALTRKKYRDYPNLVDAMLRRYEVYNQDMKLIEDMAARGNVFLFRPANPVRHMESDVTRMEEGYEEGRRDAENRLSELLDFLGEGIGNGTPGGVGRKS